MIFDRLLGREPADPPAAMWSAAEQPPAGAPPNEARIPLTAIGPPPPAELLAAALATEGFGPRVHPHTSTRKIGRVLVVDPIGLRHVDRRRLRMEPDLSFAVRWYELAHVALQIQISGNFPLEMIRLILTAADGRRFSQEHPDMQVLHNLRGLGPDTWALSLGTNDHVDVRVLEPTRQALLHFAGGRFSGQIERVQEPPTPRTL